MDTQGMFISKGEKHYLEQEIRWLKHERGEMCVLLYRLQADLDRLAESVGKKFVDVPGQRIVTKDKP
jgi:hypothetical protein